MFSSFTNLGSMIKKVHEIGGKIHEMNERCRGIRVSGSAGGGLVQIEANGLSEITNCTIDPSVFAQGDHEFLEDLIITAVNEALNLARTQNAELMRSVAGTMELPDLESLLNADDKTEEK